MCVCPPGTVDYVCATELYTRCYINITNPPFYEGCQDQFEDSFYYMYSIPGFSPCFWYNFNSSIDVEFELNVSSAHRTPAKTVEIVETGPERGVRVFICGAGAAAHLAGSLIPLRGGIWITTHILLLFIGDAVVIGAEPLRIGALLLLPRGAIPLRIEALKLLLGDPTSGRVTDR